MVVRLLLTTILAVLLDPVSVSESRSAMISGHEPRERSSRMPSGPAADSRRARKADERIIRLSHRFLLAG